jgi:hypothetical protein
MPGGASPATGFVAVKAVTGVDTSLAMCNALIGIIPEKLRFLNGETTFIVECPTIPPAIRFTRLEASVTRPVTFLRNGAQRNAVYRVQTISHSSVFDPALLGYPDIFIPLAGCTITGATGLR